MTPFGFAEDAKICRLIEMRRRCHPGAADDDGLAARAAEIDDIERVVLLRQHAAGEDQIGPVEVVVAQFLGVAVDQPQRPKTRQQRRQRDQAQRRRRIFGAEEFSGALEIPKGIRVEVEDRSKARCRPLHSIHGPLVSPPPPKAGG